MPGAHRVCDFQRGGTRSVYAGIPEPTGLAAEVNSPMTPGGQHELRKRAGALYVRSSRIPMLVVSVWQQLVSHEMKRAGCVKAKTTAGVLCAGHSGRNTPMCFECTCLRSDRHLWSTDSEALLFNIDALPRARFKLLASTRLHGLVDSTCAHPCPDSPCAWDQVDGGVGPLGRDVVDAVYVGRHDHLAASLGGRLRDALHRLCMASNETQ